MALIHCPECNREISDTVKVCPGCGYKIKKQKTKKEPKVFKTKRSKTIFTVVFIVLVCVILGTGGFFVYKDYMVPLHKYEAAVKMLRDEKFDEAVSQLEGLKDFKDSKTKVLETHYKKAEFLLNAKNFDEAITEFETAGNYKNAVEKIKEAKYLYAGNSYAEKAVSIYEELGDYKDSKEKLASAKKEIEAKEALQKMQTAYDACESGSASLASDKKSIKVDSFNKYDSDAMIDIVVIINKLGLPDSLLDEMAGTSALMGRQTETYDYYEVSWTYHPDNGLDVIFKFKE